jgi:hypothetical protein
MAAILLNNQHSNTQSSEKSAIKKPGELNEGPNGEDLSSRNGIEK